MSEVGCDKHKRFIPSCEECFAPPEPVAKPQEQRQITPDVSSEATSPKAGGSGDDSRSGIKALETPDCARSGMGGALSEEELEKLRDEIPSCEVEGTRLLATVDQFRAERDALRATTTHSCHDECEQPLCKATRDLSTALVRVAELEKTLASVPRPLGMACTACGTKEPIRATSWKCQCGQEYYDMEMAQRLSTPPSAERGKAALRAQHFREAAEIADQSPLLITGADRICAGLISGAIRAEAARLEQEARK